MSLDSDENKKNYNNKKKKKTRKIGCVRNGIGPLHSKI
jgi:hypothetical protein